MLRDEELARTYHNQSYHHLVTIDQAEPAVIGIVDTNHRKQVDIKQVVKPKDFVHQVPPSTCNQIVTIKALYVKTDEVIYI